MPPPVGASAPMADNAASALCYVLGFITGIIFLVIAPYNQNRTVRFHAFQSIFLSVAWILFRYVLGWILWGAGIFSLLFLLPIIWLAGLAIWLYMIIATYQGKTVVLPVIGQFAQQQA